MRKATALKFLGLGMLILVVKQLSRDLVTPAQTQAAVRRWISQIIMAGLDLKATLDKDSDILRSGTKAQIKEETKRLLKLLSNPVLEIDDATSLFLQTTRTCCQAILSSLESQDKLTIRIAIDNLYVDIKDYADYLTAIEKLARS